MALHRRQNIFTLGGNQSSWWVIKTLLDAGWTIPMSGSGTGGLWASGNVFDLSQTPQNSPNVPANGIGVGSEPWGKGNCWVVLEDPGGNRQYIFRRDPLETATYDNDWHWGYSHGGRFGEGQTPGTNWDQDTEPTAPDIANLVGTPTSEGSIWQDGNSPGICFTIADSVPSSAGEYGFLQIIIEPTNYCFGCVMVDPLVSSPPGHPHPLAIGYAFDTTNNTFTVGNMNFNWHMRTWTRLGEGLEAWNTINYTAPYSSGYKIPQYGGIGPDGKERAMASIVGFENNEGYMGISRWLKWAPIKRGYPRTANGYRDLFVDEAVFVDMMDGTEPPVSI